MPPDSELELNDIQSGVLRPRPSPYAATYILMRIDDRRAGRELMRRLAGVVASAAHTTSPAAADTWVSVSLTYQGLRALGLDVSQCCSNRFDVGLRETSEPFRRDPPFSQPPPGWSGR